MSLEYTLLGLLNFRPATGYDLKKAMDASTQFLSPVPLSQIYPTLKRMAEKGLVKFKMEVRSGKPDLKIYSVTGAGQKTFIAWLGQPPKLDPHFFNPFLLKFFFAGMLDKATALAYLKDELDFRTVQLNKAKTRTVAARGDYKPTKLVDIDRTIAFWRLAQTYGEQSLEAYVKWLRQAAGKVEREL